MDFTVNSQYVKPILVVNIILPVPSQIALNYRISQLETHSFVTFQLTGPDWTFSTPSDGPSLQMVRLAVTPYR